MNNEIQRLSPAEYQTHYVKGARAHVLVDVRTPEEFRQGHISGAINIELDALARRAHELPHGQPIVLYCRSGRRSEMGAAILAQMGYASISDLGGIIDWQRQGLPVR